MYCKSLPQYKYQCSQISAEKLDKYSCIIVNRDGGQGDKNKTQVVGSILYFVLLPCKIMKDRLKSELLKSKQQNYHII